MLAGVSRRPGTLGRAPTHRAAPRTHREMPNIAARIAPLTAAGALVRTGERRGASAAPRVRIAARCGMEPQVCAASGSGAEQAPGAVGVQGHDGRALSRRGWCR